MNKSDIINAYSQLGIRDVTVYVMKGWDSHINPLTTISPEQGVYNLTVLEEPQFKRLLSSLHLADGFDNELRNINCNIIITHQVDFCRFVGVYTYGQIPTKVHQFITDAGVNEINKLTKLQQGRIATFYLTLRNNPLFAMVEKIIDYDGNTYDEVMAKIYDTYRVFDINFESLITSQASSAQDYVQEERLGRANVEKEERLGGRIEPEERLGGRKEERFGGKIEPEERLGGRTEKVTEAVKAPQPAPAAQNTQPVQPEKVERVKPMNITNNPLSNDDLELFRANLKQSIIDKLDPIFDDIIDQEINRFKSQIEQNILTTIRSHLVSK